MTLQMSEVVVVDGKAYRSVEDWQLDTAIRKAGLDKCPWCGAGVASAESLRNIKWECCSSYVGENRYQATLHADRCVARMLRKENVQLRQEVRDLRRQLDEKLGTI